MVKTQQEYLLIFGVFTANYGLLLSSQVVVMVIGIVITEALNKAVDLKKYLNIFINKSLGNFPSDFFNFSIDLYVT